VSPTVALIAALVIPTVGALLIALTGRWPNLRETVTLVAAVLLCANVVSLVGGVFAGGRPELVLLDIAPGLALVLQVEPLGMVFALIASSLWIVSSIYSIGYMRGHGEPRQTMFYVAFALALASACGVAFAGNLFTLFLFYEALTLSTYPLVTHSATPEAMRAGRLYLIMLLGTSLVLFLPALMWTWGLAGTLEFAPGGILAGRADGLAGSVLLLLFVFGIGKAAVMPMHRWLPAAMVAPTPVSALLHAVAVVKAGVFSILKVAIYIFGADYLADLWAGEALRYVAAATILIASLVAMTKDNLKARLAYSTISQLSYIVLGAMLANSLGFIGGGMHMATHAMGKITLFFCAGAIMVASHKTEISQMRGLGRTMPITMAAFLIGSLSVIGLPPAGGLWSKWYLALGTIDVGDAVLLGVLMVSSLLNIGYLLPIPLRAFFQAPDDDGHASHSGDAPSGIKEAPLPCLIALVLTSVGCIVLFFFPGPMFELLSSIGGR